MNHPSRFAIAVALSWMIVLPVAAQYRTDQPSITTSGSAEVRVVPDRIEIAVGVETVDVELAVAKAANDSAVARVVDAGRRHGIDPAKIQTDFIEIQPDYETRPLDRPVRYIVRRSIVIVSQDLAGFEGLLSALVEAGANHVHGIRFMTSELRRYRDEARRLAAKAALEKARLLAESLGRTVGRAQHVSESADYWGSSYGSWWGRWGGSFQNVSQTAAAPGGELAEGPLAPGRISVSATVNVTFELE